jgi:hypothetical protein
MKSGEMSWKRWNECEAGIFFIAYESKKKKFCDLFSLVGYLTMLSVSCR